MPEYGIIFNIQRYTIHDGPGIRTELFFKGCPLQCRWCGNPESHKVVQQPGIYPIKCIGEDKCGCCTDVCEQSGSLIFHDHKLLAIDRQRCTNCMKCAEVCPADAIKLWGRRVSVEEAMETVRKDVSYYNSSGGGVTCSGGEPLTQLPFLQELLKTCRQEGIHTCVETTLCADWNSIEKIVSDTDLFITDLKHMDAAVHKQYTGLSNDRILDNMQRLAELEKPLIVRIPVIPGVNDTKENMEKSADFILGKLKNQVEELQLLEFMRLGEEKYKPLDLTYPMEGLEFDRDAFTLKIKDFAEYFQSRGISCKIGTTTKEGKGNDKEQAYRHRGI